MVNCSSAEPINSILPAPAHAGPESTLKKKASNTTVGLKKPGSMISLASQKLYAYKMMTAVRNSFRDWIAHVTNHLIRPQINLCCIIFQQMASRLTAAAFAVALLLCVVSFDNQVYGITATFTKTVLGKQGETIMQNFAFLSFMERTQIIIIPTVATNSRGWRIT